MSALGLADLDSGEVMHGQLGLQEANLLAPAKVVPGKGQMLLAQLAQVRVDSVASYYLDRALTVSNQILAFMQPGSRLPTHVIRVDSAPAPARKRVAAAVAHDAVPLTRNNVHRARCSPSPGGRSAGGVAGQQQHLSSDPAATPVAISVAVRSRPLNDVEVMAGDQDVWEYDPAHGRVWEAGQKGVPSREHRYGNLFGPSTTTTQVYESMALPVVQAALQGINGTLFAYGQTGSGKTYTVSGGSDGEPGMLLLALHDVFRAISEARDTEFLVRASYLEIYNEELYDLFDPDSSGALRIVDNSPFGPYIKGLTEEVILTPGRALELLTLGEANRHVAATAMNARSSRSHTLFRLTIESRAVLPGSGAVGGMSGHAKAVVAAGAAGAEAARSVGALGKAGDPFRQPASLVTDGHSIVRVASLHLIDLAGSERVSKSHAAGVALKEAGTINVSLLTLGVVITKLTAGEAHVPYRDSKLTRLLSTSLGGNARTSIVVCISPAAVNLGETRSSLAFASRAMKVLNRAKVNEIADETSLLQKYKMEVERLQKLLAEQQQSRAMLGGEANDAADAHARADADGRIHALQEQLQAAILRGQDGALAAADMQQLLFVVTHASGHVRSLPSILQTVHDVCQGRLLPGAAVRGILSSVPKFALRLARMIKSGEAPMFHATALASELLEQLARESPAKEHGHGHGHGGAEGEAAGRQDSDGGADAGRVQRGMGMLSVSALRSPQGLSAVPRTRGAHGQLAEVLDLTPQAGTMSRADLVSSWLGPRPSSSPALASHGPVGSPTSQGGPVNGLSGSGVSGSGLRDSGSYDKSVDYFSPASAVRQLRALLSIKEDAAKAAQEAAEALALKQAELDSMRRRAEAAEARAGDAHGRAMAASDQAAAELATLKSLRDDNTRLQREVDSLRAEALIARRDADEARGTAGRISSQAAESAAGWEAKLADMAQARSEAEAGLHATDLRCKHLEHVNGLLQRQLTDATNALQRQRSLGQAMDGAREDAAHAASVLKEELRLSEARVASLESECATLRHEALEAATRQAALQSDFEQLSAAKAGVQASYDSLQAVYLDTIRDRDAAVERARSAERDVSLAKRQLAARESDLQAQGSGRESAEKDLLVTRHAAAASDMRVRDLEGRLAAAVDELSHMRGRVADSEAAAASVRTKLDGKRAQLAEVSAMLEDTRARASAAEAAEDAKARRVSELELELRSRKAAVANDAEGTQERLATLQAQLREATGRNADLQAAVIEAEHRAETAELHASQYAVKIEDLASKLREAMAKAAADGAVAAGAADRHARALESARNETHTAYARAAAAEDRLVMQQLKLDDLIVRLADEQARHANARDALVELRAELADTQAQAGAEAARVAELSTQLSDKSSAIARLQGEVASRAGEVPSLTSSLQAARQAVERLKGQVAAHAATIADKDRQLSDTEALVQSKTLSLQASAEEHGRLTAVVASLREDNGRLAEELSAAESRAARELKTLRHQLSVSQAERDDLQSRLADATAALADTERVLAGMRSQLEGLQGQMGVARHRIQALEAEVARLQDEKAEAQQYGTEQAARAAAVEAAVSVARADAAAAASQAHLSASQAQEIMEQVQKARLQLDELQSEYRQLFDRYQACVGSEGEARHQVHVLDQQMDREVQRSQEAEARARELSMQLVECHRRIDGLQQELAEARADDQSDRVALHSRLAELARAQEAIRQLQTAKDGLQAAHDQLQDVHTDLEDRHVAVARHRDELSQAVQQMEGGCQRLELALADTTAELQAGQAHERQLQAENTEVQVQLADATQKAATLSSQLQETVAQHADAMQQERSRYQRETTALQDEISKLQHATEALLIDRTRLSEALAQAQADLRTARENFDASTAAQAEAARVAGDKARADVEAAEKAGQDALQAALADLESMTRSRDRTASHLHLMEEERNNFRDRASALEAEKDVATTRMRTVQEQLATARARVDKLEDVLEERNARIEALQEDIAQAEETAAHHEETAHQAHAELGQVQRELQDQQEAVQQLETALAETRASLRAAQQRASALESQADEVRGQGSSAGELETVRHQLSDAKMRLAELQGAASIANQTIAALRGELKVQMAETRAARDALLELKSRFAETSDERTAAVLAAEQASSELAVARARLLSLQREVSDCRGETSRLRQELVSARATAQRANREARQVVEAGVTAARQDMAAVAGLYASSRASTASHASLDSTDPPTSLVSGGAWLVPAVRGAATRAFPASPPKPVGMAGRVHTAGQDLDVTAATDGTVAATSRSFRSTLPLPVATAAVASPSGTPRGLAQGERHAAHG